MTTSRKQHPRPARHAIGILLALVALAVAACGGDNDDADGLPRPPEDPNLPPGVIYQDNFEQDFGYWDVDDDNIVSYVIQNGQLMVTIDRANLFAWSGLNFLFDDFVLDVEATKLAGPDDNGFGVLFRYQDNQNYYRFDISSDGFYALSEAVDGTLEAVSEWHTSDAIQQGEATNRIRLRAQGNSFSFAVNDTPLALCVGPQAIWDVANPDTCLGGELVETWTDDTFSSGQIALTVRSFREPGPSIGFDNLVIRTPDSAP